MKGCDKGGTAEGGNFVKQLKRFKSFQLGLLDRSAPDDRSVDGTQFADR